MSTSYSIPQSMYVILVSSILFPDSGRVICPSVSRYLCCLHTCLSMSYIVFRWKMPLVYCCVSGCRSTSMDAGVRFHTVSKNYATSKQWQYVVNRPGWFPAKYSKICSKHFSYRFGSLQPGMAPDIRAENCPRCSFFITKGGNPKQFRSL